MGTCKYCGCKAGLLSKTHRECEEKHSDGLRGLEQDLRMVISNNKGDCSRLRTSLPAYRSTNFLSEDDIVTVFDKVIREYTLSMHRPYSPRSMHIVDDIINILNVPYQLISAKRGLDEFTKKLMRGFMVDYFTDKLPLPVAQQRCGSVLKRFPMSQSQIDDAYWHVLDRAATNFLSDGSLSDDEQRKITDFTQTLSLSLNNIPKPYQNGDISKLSQVALIKALQNGIVPSTNFQAPIILGKKESVFWAYNGVSCYQEKITKEWVGRNNGFSFRVCKGVYYRTGRSKGHPVERSSMELQGMGTLYVTNKNLIFWSQMKNLKIPFSKIIGFTPYSDGIEVHRDGATAKRLTFQGFDPWFIMNVISQLTNLQ
jgi:hypothetical protein